jgi:uncharacterized protein (TIGR00730 family)
MAESGNSDEGTSALRAPPEGRGRREPLPTSRPKPAEDDPEARERVHRIIEHPSYQRADEDPHLLQRDELRGVRLQLEYRKPEAALMAAGVRGTIVVFGGTRVLEPAAAGRAAERARRACAEAPEDAELRRRLEVAERRVETSRYYDVARELGRIVGRACGGASDCPLAVVTGGGPGLMEAANRGADDVGARSVGLNIALPHEQFPNPYITPGLCFQFRYFGLRKMHFMKRARALVAFPGGYGTLDEIFDAVCLIQTRKIDPLPIVLVGESYWRRVFDAGFLADEGMIDVEDLEILSYADTADAIWRRICEWYDLAGLPVVPEGG